MLNSEREAKNLIDAEDRSSWSARGRMHKAYRSMALTPDEEIPRHRRSRKDRKKHIHKWGPWSLLRTEWRYGYTFNPDTGNYRRNKTPDPLYILERVCKKCGHKDWARSPSKGGPVGNRYRYWL